MFQSDATRPASHSGLCFGDTARAMARRAETTWGLGRDKDRRKARDPCAMFSGVFFCPRPPARAAAEIHPGTTITFVRIEPF